VVCDAWERNKKIKNNNKKKRKERDKVLIVFFTIVSTVHSPFGEATESLFRQFQ